MKKAVPVILRYDEMWLLAGRYNTRGIPYGLPEY